MRPAEGEGAAVAGYRYQYEVSGSLVLRGLMDGSLDWVRLKDVGAGRVDDFVLGSGGRVDGYQVKHRASSFSFRMLLQEDSEGNPALIRQLAEGWEVLRGTHGGRVVVHLVANARPSAHDKVGDAPVPRGTRRSFARFLEEAWAPARRAAVDSPGAVPAEWAEG